MSQRMINGKPLEPRLRRAIRAAGRSRARRGVKAFVVGGFVRDLLLRRRNLDLDISVEGDAPALGRELAVTLGAGLVTHPRFGTATLTAAGGLKIDVATARAESYARPGALPTVRPGTLRDDLFRRDFTINAIGAAVHAGGLGALVDCFGGEPDLKLGLVRVLHDRSFLDDPTRILRAVRFEQRFGFRLEPATARLLAAALRQKAEETVKPPRYYQEFRKGFDEAAPLKYLRRLERLGALRFLGLRRRIDGPLVARIQRRLSAWRRNNAGGPRGRDTLYLLALAGPMEAVAAGRLARRFHLNKEQQRCLGESARAAAAMQRLGRGRMTRSDVYRCLEGFAGDTVWYIRAAASSRRAQERARRFLDEDRGAKLGVTGHDIMRWGGTGRSVGRILRAVLMKKIDGGLPRKADEVREARRLCGRAVDGEPVWDEWKK